MANIFNRLQFVKHEEVFPTREEAVAYVVNKQAIERPSLLAEPMILLYGESENPSVILAIGSVGDGETASIANKTFFIDFQKAEDEIAELDEKIEEAIKSLTLIPMESDTLDLHSEKTDDGTYVSGDVKVASAQVISGISRDNKIKVVENEGLFLYVNVEYTEDGKLIFRVNDEVDEFSIPSVVSGEYVYTGDDAENIVLTQNDGSQVKIDVGHLIDEWTVLPEDATPTPIVLSREEVSGEPCPHGVEVWQDVLTADVRIKNEDDNILEKVNDGRELYVGGKAENIAYYKDNGDRSTVKEQLDRIKLNIDGENILTEGNDGFFASVKLDYVSEENKLVFIKSTVTGGTVTKNIELNSVEFLEDITYDPATEEIVIRYVDNKGEHKQLRIPASFVIEEWKVDNENHNIELVKTRNAEDNKDVLTADAKIHTGDNNILEDKEHTLYVRGEADNIKYGNDSNVEAEINALKESDSDINTRIDDEISRAETAEGVLDNKIDQEIADRITDVDEEETRATAAETVLTNKIGTGFTDDPHKNVTYKFNELQTAISDEVTRAQGVEGQLQTAISDEVTRAEGVEDSLSGAIETEKTRAEGVENALQGEIAAEKTRAEGVESNLQNAITNEETRAIAAETVLTNKVGTGFTDDPHENVTFKFNELQTAISDEVTRAQGVENSLSDAIATENTRAEGVEGQLQTAISDEVTRAQGVENSLSGAIATENTRAEGVEEVLTNKIGTGFTDDPHENITFKFNELDGKIETEINRAESVEREISATVISNYEILDNKISGITLSFEDSGSIDFTKSTNNVVTADVILQGGDNIIKNVGSGLYATAHLSYDVATNKIKLTTSYGEEEYQLSAGAIIDNIYYDDTTGDLVITYTNAEGTQTVRFSVSKLFNEWEIDQNNCIGMKLYKDPPTQTGDPDKLRGEVLISNHPDNAIVLDGNHLYVSSSAMSESKEIAECAKNEVISLKSIMGVTFGDCSSAATYSAPGTHFIVDAQSMQDADRILDDTLYHLVNDWFFLGSNTQSARLTFKDEGENRKGFVEVRLSHGNRAYDESTNNTTNEEMDYGDLEISALTDSEFSDTNVLKMVKIEESSSHEPLDPDNKYNGIFLSNIWNCGTLNSEGVPTDDYNGTETPIDYSN